MLLTKKTFALIVTGIILLLFSTSYQFRNRISADEVDLLLFYGSFNGNHDGFLAFDELISLFNWCQSEIKYQAHEGYQSPVKTFKTRRGDCLDISLLIAQCFHAYYRQDAYIGNIAVANQDRRVNHACCLMPVTEDYLNCINRYLGYRVNYFDLPDNDLLYVIIDPLCCAKFGKLNLNTNDYGLVEIRYLRQYYFSDLSTITTNR